MNITKAVEILKAQISKPDIKNFDYSAWKMQTSSIIQMFFGKDSDEYKKINIPTIRYYSGYETQTEKIQIRNSEIQSIRSILEASIETIKVKGLYKEPKSNIVSHLNNYALIVCAFGLIAFGFYSHKFIVDETKDSKLTSPTIIDTNRISNAKADSIKNNKDVININFDSTKK